MAPRSSHASRASAPRSADLDCGREVIAQEIRGLEALAGALDAQFERAVSLIAGLKGRLIVSGMGKSGHVARKIAATLASTGSPAHFVHPSEASHGDLGMITKNDALLLLSNSGETKELKDLIAYSRRFNIPLIGMARRPKSLLVSSADVALVLPEVDEASPVGVPTTSTTMMMAYGDALAVALLRRNGFTRSDFNTLHPGGRLGETLLLRVKDLMHPFKDTPCIEKHVPMSDALIEMTKKSFGCVAVINKTDRKLLGIITDGDLRRQINKRKNFLALTAGSVMTPGPSTVTQETLAAEALRVMNEKKITCLLVVGEASKVLGIIHLHDCLRAGVM